MGGVGGWCVLVLLKLLSGPRKGILRADQMPGTTLNVEVTITRLLEPVLTKA